VFVVVVIAVIVIVRHRTSLHSRQKRMRIIVRQGALSHRAQQPAGDHE
jgi:hypothetical protein